MKRRSSLAISDVELDSYMKILVDSFGLSWLEDNANHPIQLLWKRNDELSTSELYSLSYAIGELAKVDSTWVNKQLQIVKSNNKNNYKGALFELLGLNMMNDPVDHPVKPAKFNQAGYDGLITRKDRIGVRVSIKNYGISKFQATFEQKCKSIEIKIINLLRRYQYPAVQILLDFPEKYPNDRDWKLLENNLDGIFKNQRNSKDHFSAWVQPLNPKTELSRENSRTIFLISICPFLYSKEKFHEKFNSYTLMISAQYHKNESLNLFSKINDACSNLLKHSANENETTINALLLHLPDAISLDQCFIWLERYFEEFPNKQISYVFLYQVTVTTDINTNKTSINHSFKFYIKKGKQLYGNYNFCIPVGIVTNESSTIKYIAEYPNGVKKEIPLVNRYIYQHGEHYMKMISDGKGGYSGNIKRLGNGVHTSVVLELPGQNKTAVIKGRLPPSDELLIL